MIARAALAVALAAGGATGCEDIRRFDGAWVGPIAADPTYQQGFSSGALARANVTEVSREQLRMTVALPERGGAVPVELPFVPIRRASGDALGDLRLEGEPLRTYLGFLEPPGAQPYLTVVSMFPDDRIVLRVIRGGDETYGLFSLRRAP